MTLAGAMFEGVAASLCAIGHAGPHFSLPRLEAAGV